MADRHTVLARWRTGLTLAASISGLGLAATLVLPAHAQVAATEREFEAASIKVNKSASGRFAFGPQSGGRFTVTNLSLKAIVSNAYQVPSFRVVGGPAWFDSDHFDITAKAAGNAKPDEILAMARTLLAKRFNLKLHHESRDLPIYALVRARADGRLGSSLKPSSMNCSEAARSAAPPSAAAGGRPACGGSFNGSTLIAGGIPLTDLASTLSNALGRTVVDRSGLSGNYDIDLTFTPDATMGRGGTAAVAEGSSIFTALIEQLGLKLEATKGPVDVLVVESAERPSEN